MTKRSVMVPLWSFINRMIMMDKSNIDLHCTVATSDSWIVNGGVSGTTCRNTDHHVVSVNLRDIYILYILPKGAKIIISLPVAVDVISRSSSCPTFINAELPISKPISSMVSLIAVSSSVSLASFLPPGNATCPDHLIPIIHISKQWHVSFNILTYQFPLLLFE